MAYKNPEDRKTYHRLWYQANRAKKAEQSKEWHDANYERHMDLQAKWAMERRQKLAQYKLERGCARCGYRGHPAALHFDHLPGHEKAFTIAQIYKRKWERVLEEIAKCQILCANCHAIQTAERGYVKRKPQVQRQKRLKEQSA